MGQGASSLIQPLIQAMSFGLRAQDMAHGQYWIHPALPEVIENALLAPVRRAAMAAVAAALTFSDELGREVHSAAGVQRSSTFAKCQDRQRGSTRPRRTSRQS